MITRTLNTSLTEEQWNEQNPDTNCNDLVTMEISVNGKRYITANNIINTQQEYYELQTKFMELIERLKLKDLSRFRA